MEQVSLEGSRTGFVATVREESQPLVGGMRDRGFLSVVSTVEDPSEVSTTSTPCLLPKCIREK